MKRLNEVRDAEVLALLSPDQRTLFETLKGKPFDVQQLMPFGFGRGGPPGFGPGGPTREKRKLLAKYDKNGDGWLNREERQPAREVLKAERDSQPAGNRGQRFGGSPGGGPPGFGPPGFPGREDLEPAQPGVQIKPEDVTPQPDKPLYDLAVLRTIFLDVEADHNHPKKRCRLVHQQSRIYDHAGGRAGQRNGGGYQRRTVRAAKSQLRKESGGRGCSSRPRRNDRGHYDLGGPK